MEPSRACLLVCLVVASLWPALLCCPSLPEPDPIADKYVGLDEVQLDQVMVDVDRVMRLAEDPQLLQDPQNQRPVVQLTSEQETDLLLLYPALFVHDNCSAQNVKRQTNRWRACPALTRNEPNVLAFTSDGDLVQLAQLTKRNQLVFDEQCLQQQQSDTLVCDVIVRKTLALFINLSGIAANDKDHSNFIFSYVIVNHCGAFV